MKNAAPFRFRSTSAVAAALFLSACTDYEFAAQDIAVRYDAQVGVLTLEIDTRGLYPSAYPVGQLLDSKLPHTVKEVRRVADGARSFHLITWPLVFDLDPPMEDSPALASAGDSEVDPAVVRGDATQLDPIAAPLSKQPSIAPLGWKTLFDRSVAVVDASMRYDEHGEVALHQAVRVENAQACLGVMNSMIRQILTLELSEVVITEEGAWRGGHALWPKDSMFSSRASIDNLLAYARTGRPYVELSAEALVVHIPMMPADVAAWMKFMASDAKDALEEGATLYNRRSAAAREALLRPLGSFTLEGNVATLRFPANEKGVIHWALDGPRSERARDLAAALK